MHSFFPRNGKNKTKLMLGVDIGTFTESFVLSLKSSAEQWSALCEGTMHYIFCKYFLSFCNWFSLLAFKNPLAI